jgi:hypothetical protein
LAGNFVLGGVLLLATVALVAAMRARGIDLPADRAVRATDIARAGAMSLAGAVSTLCFIRWRIGAETSVLLIGTAILVFGVVVVGISALVLPVVEATDLNSPLIPAVRAAGLIVMLALLVLAIMVAEVNTRLRASRVVVGSLVGVAVFTAILDRMPDTAAVLAFGRRFPLASAPPSTGNRLVLSAVWTALALVLCIRGLRNRRSMFAWSGLMLLALALSELMAIDALDETDIRLFGSELLQVLAVGLVLVGVVTEFERNFLDQRARLFDSLVAMRAVQTRARLGNVISGRRRHDVGNALMALEGAASTLERYYDRLGPDERRQLAEMVGTSVSRMRGLSQVDPTEAVPLALVDAAKELAEGLTGGGVDVDVRVPPDVLVRSFPEETTEVLAQVAKAVRDEDPQGTVRVSAVRFGDTAWLSVEFCPGGAAAGAAHDSPSSPLARLRRRATPRSPRYLGRGMDLSVAAHLLSERGGQLIAEPVGDDEIAIRLQLPAYVPGPTS